MKYKITIKRHISAVEDFIIEEEDQAMAEVRALRNAADPSAWPFVTEEADAAGRIHIENIAVINVEALNGARCR